MLDHFAVSALKGLIDDFVEFSSVITKLLFLEGRLGSRLCLHSMLKFPKISTFSKILHLKAFGYIQFVVVIIKFHFTCGEGKFC